MTLKNILQKIAIGTGVILGYAGVLGGCNYYHHGNLNYMDGNVRIMEKVDGIVSSTKIEIYNNERQVWKEKPLSPTVMYEDTNGDGKVDHIYHGMNIFARAPVSKEFYRDKDLKNNKKMFEDADKAFSKELKRFKL